MSLSGSSSSLTSLYELLTSERVLVEAALYNTKEMMQLLMDNGGSHILITEEMFCSAAANE